MKELKERLEKIAQKEDIGTCYLLYFKDGSWAIREGLNSSNTTNIIKGKVDSDLLGVIDEYLREPVTALCYAIDTEVIMDYNGTRFIKEKK